MAGDSPSLTQDQDGRSRPRDQGATVVTRRRARASASGRTAQPDAPPAASPTAPRGPSGPRWGRIAFVLVVGILLISAITAGIFRFVAEQAVDDIPTQNFDRDTLAEANANAPQNFLIIGSDERPPEMFDPSAAGKRSDTMMLVQIDPKAANAKVLSLPRDTRVEIPGHGLEKLNASFAYGGPQLAIQTLKQFTGLPIHHYIEIDFEGLVGIVDALGGVDICVDEPMRDPRANIWFGKIGCYTVDGSKALVFARSRSMQLLRNGKWEEDGTADLGRIHRQQLFLKAVLKKAMSVKALKNWQEVADGVKKGVIIDDGLGLSQFLALYDKFQDLDPEKVDMKTVPGHPQMIGGASYYIAEREKLTPILVSFGAVPTGESTPAP